MIRNIFLLVLSALCAWSCTALDDAIVQGPATEPQPADAPHSLRITVAPKPAFAEAAINMPDGIPLPQTRTVQTEEGTKWEEGDLVWLHVDFTDDSNRTTIHYSALKYTGTTWRYLTETEANSLELKSYPNKSTFNRTLIYGQADGSTQYVKASIRAYYTGNSKPDANGLITIPAPDSGSSVPVMEAYSATLGDLSQPLTLDFTYRCSRLRIPADYGVQMENYKYYASCNLTGGVLNIKTTATPLDLPATAAPRDIFLLPIANGQDTPATITLTRSGGATWTFTPRPGTGTATSARDYFGQSYTLPDLAPGGVTPGEM